MPWITVTEDFTFFETETVEAEIFGVKRTANGFYSCSRAYLGFSGVSYGSFVSGYPRFLRLRPGSLRLPTMHVVSVDGDTRSRIFLAWLIFGDRARRCVRWLFMGSFAFFRKMFFGGVFLG